MVPQTETFENISVNIYETGTFSKFDERGPGTNFFHEITKSNFETLRFKPNEVKPYLRSTQYLKKLNVSHVSIRSIKRNFENFKALLEECELVFNIIFNIILFKLHRTATKQFKSFSRGIRFFPLRKE